MKKLIEAEDFQLKRDYGEPLLVTPEGKCKGLNEQYFASYFSKSIIILYDSQGKAFYEYIEGTGTWKHATNEKVNHLIGLFLLWYANVYAMSEIKSYRNASSFSSIMKLLKGFIETPNAFANRKRFYYHCANCMVEFITELGQWETREFSPDYYSREQLPFAYKPESKCPKFIEQLLKNAMTPDDIELLKLYIGQCMLGVNLSQTFLLLIGTPGGGKSTLVNVIEKLIGRWNCVELRLTHMTGRFEISAAKGKTLLTGKDVSSDFMNGPGARALKVLTGNDTVTAEYKNQNTRHDMPGTFNVIITSNNLLRIKFDGDIDAWRRRILVIKYENPPPEKVITGFDDKLLEEEGSGILNWAMEGAVQLFKSEGKITKSKEQRARVDMLLNSSQPFDVFGNLYIHPTPGVTITTEEAVTYFFRFCKQMDWPETPERNAQKAFHAWMRSTYGAILRTDIKRHGRNKRGYVGYKIREK